MNEGEILENALDTLEHGIQHYTQGKLEKDDVSLRFSVLHLSQSVELLLKERLRREHWSLVFKKLDGLKDPWDSDTVNVRMAIDRLSHIAKVTIDEEHQTAIENLQRVRNRIQHFYPKTTDKEVLVLIGQTLPFIERFTREELGVELRDQLETEEWQELLEIKEIFTRALESAMEEVGRRCYDAKDTSEVSECPFCGNDTMLPSEDGGAMCLLCMHESELVRCDRCGNPFPRDAWRASVSSEVGGGPTWCENCVVEFERMLEKD